MATASSNNDPTLPPQTRYNFTRTVTVLVSSTETKFVVHKDIICQSSGFFRAACCGDWIESQEGIVRLRDIDVFLFGVYLGWLYIGEIDIAEGVTYDQGITVAQYDTVVGRLIYAYAAAYILSDANFRNAIVDDFFKLVEGADKLPSPPQVKKMWDTVPHSSKMARLWIDYYQSEYQISLFNKDVSSYPESFVVAIAKAAVRERRSEYQMRLPKNRDRCASYHEHTGVIVDGCGKGNGRAVTVMPVKKRVKFRKWLRWLGDQMSV